LEGDKGQTITEKIDVSKWGKQKTEKSMQEKTPRKESRAKKKVKKKCSCRRKVQSAWLLLIYKICLCKILISETFLGPYPKPCYIIINK